MKILVQALLMGAAVLLAVSCAGSAEESGAAPAAGQEELVTVEFSVSGMT